MTLAYGHEPDPDARTVTMRCRACGEALEPWGVGYWKHAKPRCGAPMRNSRERCARYAGHAEGNGGGHRTRWALDNQLRAKADRRDLIAA